MAFGDEYLAATKSAVPHPAAAAVRTGEAEKGEAGLEGSQSGNDTGNGEGEAGNRAGACGAEEIRERRRAGGTLGGSERRLRARLELAWSREEREQEEGKGSRVQAEGRSEPCGWMGKESGRRKADQRTWKDGVQ